MKRYRHYLCRPSRNDWPDNIYCVAADRDGNAAVQWLMRRGGVYHLLHRNALRGREEWYRYLSQTICSGGAAVIVSYRCPGVWSALGLWEDIESGRIRITEDPEGRTQEEVGRVPGVRQTDAMPSANAGRAVLPRVSKLRSPYLVLDDPPCIVGFRVRGRPGVVTWIDMRNYGVEFNNVKETLLEQCVRCGRFMASQAEISSQLRLGSFRPTAGSQAMHAWRKSYMPRGCYAHDDKDALSVESASIYGGRAEAFRLGAIRERVVHRDMRSCYGAIMADEILPIRLVRVAHGSAADELVRRSFTEAVIATVTIETDEPAYPLRRGSEVIWPVGRFTTTLPGPELSDAMLRGRIVRSHDAVLYQCEGACESFASAVWGAIVQLGPRSEDGVRGWLKRLLVSLPGKLGQRNRTWVPVANPGACQPYGSWYGTAANGEQYRCRAIAGRVYREYVEGFAPDAIPAVAAWITSCGRMRLLQLIRGAGWDNVLYCDTDAVIVNDCGAANIGLAGYAQGSGIGQLRTVYAGNGLHIYGVKHYTEEGRVTFAGVPRGTIADCGDGVHYEYTPAPSDELRTGRRPAAETSIRQYPSRERYTLGCVQRDGRVKPHYVWE